MPKREGGKSTYKNGELNYKVIEESQKAGGVLFHSCGELIELVFVTLTHRTSTAHSSSTPGGGGVKEKWIPICPNCEHAPTHGFYYDTGQEIMTKFTK